MAEEINPQKLPSTDWDWLESNNLWNRNAAAAWYYPKLETERALALLSSKKELRLLTGNGKTAADFKGENLTHLRGFGKLKKLSIPRILDDADMEYIGQLGKLSTLYISGSKLSDNGLKYLSGLTKLKEFEIDWLPPGGEALRILSTLPKLSFIGLQETDVTDEDLAPLKNSKLKKLNIGCKNVTGESLKYIGQITTLQELMLGSYSFTQKVTDDSLKHLSGLVNLKRLTLYGTEITASGLAHLTPLKSLKKLRLDKHLCKTPEAKALKEKIPGLGIGENK